MTGIEGHFLFSLLPPQDFQLNAVCLFVLAIINWLIVSKPVEIYCSVEIRPDCMIINGADVFWSRYMENGWPSFRPDVRGNQVLCGTYGTRYVGYLTVRRFDEYDCMPEVFASHLQDAMQQLWMSPRF